MIYPAAFAVGVKVKVQTKLLDVTYPNFTYPQYSAFPWLAERRALFKNSAEKKQEEKVANQDRSHLRDFSKYPELTGRT